MFDHSTPEIDAFRDMFDAADRAPVLVKSATMFADPISGAGERFPNPAFVTLYPNLTLNGKISIFSNRSHQLNVYSPAGKLLQSISGQNGAYEVQLNGKGIHILQFADGKGRVQTERVVVH